ncbi:hypothetical protein KFK14_19515 [Sphingobium phenoxybenzoativorans]|uniref:Cell envelope biogenesis protein TolA n=1 Tax=Sphingobium phenoxybenzoativorans TaxID=1592790 RepID=A0A975K6C1_9SPHN|nr:hypothetical protein [Sphingobium phenoxybenzoativorans]QUT05164.1 hypothetical protein KFK14_19515 [Sphingobium phenoxybenzoativorans]
MAKLKVFRTPIGFHDAYVAAPSQKAALSAWGADANLFARGIAELVTEERLMRAPLEKPGAIIRVPRTAECAVSNPQSDKTSRRKRVAKPASPAMCGKVNPLAKAAPKTASPSKSGPRPSRAKLDKAEKALADADIRFAERERTLKAQEQAAKEERRQLRARHDKDMATLRQKRDRAKADYRDKLEIWAEH